MRLNISSVAVGIAIGLSVVAVILALWSVVADAPWEEVQVIVREVAPEVAPLEDPSQAELCLHLIDLLSISGDAGVSLLWRVWAKVGCDDYITGFAK